MPKERDGELGDEEQDGSEQSVFFNPMREAKRDSSKLPIAYPAINRDEPSWALAEVNEKVLDNSGMATDQVVRLA